MEFVIVILLIWGIPMWIAGGMAERRGHSALFGGFVGLFFSWFGLILAAFLPDRRQAKALRKELVALREEVAALRTTPPGKLLRRDPKESEDNR